MARWTLLLIALGTTSCPGDEEECVEVSTDCAPLYEPTFDEIFDRTLQPTCGVAGSSCHAPEGARGGLVLAEPDAAYDALKERLTAGDAGCSLVVRRLESSDADFQMPPGAPLSAEERCVFVQWIADGAER